MFIIELLFGFAELVVGFFRLFKKDKKRPDKSVPKEIGKRLLALLLYFFCLLIS